MGDEARKAALMSGRFGKSAAMVECAKSAQARGERSLWATNDQAATSEMLSKHGALCEVIGTHFLRPIFRKDTMND